MRGCWRGLALRGRATEGLVSGAMVLWVIVGSAMAAEFIPPSKWVVLMEPQNLASALRLPIAGAKRTCMVPGVLVDPTHADPMTRPQFEQMGADWGGFMEVALSNATEVLEQTPIHYQRGRGDVVQYAWLESKDPRLASVVLLPGFAGRFEEMLGPKLHVVIPHRNLVYVFPALGGDLRANGPKFVRLYGDATWPVSLEVFEVAKGSDLRVVGTFDSYYEEPPPKKKKPRRKATAPSATPTPKASPEP